MNELIEYWDSIYQETADCRLGWYEEDPGPMSELLEKVGCLKGRTVILPGVGTSMLIEELLDAGADVVANDISPSAIEKLKVRLSHAMDRIQWVCQNIAHPFGVDIPAADLWVDRAVLHFLMDEADITGYFDNLYAKVKAGGHVVFALFPPHGAVRCAGLRIKPYSPEELSRRLGEEFTLVEQQDYTYINPMGEQRAYIYALFRRNA